MHGSFPREFIAVDFSSPGIFSVWRQQKHRDASRLRGKVRSEISGSRLDSRGKRASLLAPALPHFSYLYIMRSTRLCI